MKWRIVIAFSLAFVCNASAAGVTYLITYTIGMPLHEIIGVMIGGGIVGAILTTVVMIPDGDDDTM